MSVSTSPSAKSPGVGRLVSGGSGSGALERVAHAIRLASDGLVERELLPELVLLAAVAREHLLIIGPPGTAKSEAVRRVSRTVQASYFEYLLGRFTEPNELFGPVDLSLLRQGRVETDTANMLPEAEFAFLDEVFLASNAILNTLLGILNERHFVRGHTRKQCPLKVCVGASNQLPEDPSLAAFADRFLLTVFVEPVPDASLETLLELGAKRVELSRAASIADVDVLAKLAEQVSLDDIRPLLARGVRTLRSAGIALSDRRLVRCQRLVAAACALRGETKAGPEDLWPVVYAIQGMDDQLQAQEVLRELLESARNSALLHASEAAAASSAARAERLLGEGKKLADRDADTAVVDHSLRVEAWLREVDASLDEASMPEALVELRKQFRQELES